MNAIHTEKQMQTLCVYFIAQFIIVKVLPIEPIWMLILTLLTSYCLKKRVDYVKKKYDEPEDDDDLCWF